MIQGPIAHIVLELFAYIVGGFLYRSQSSGSLAPAQQKLQYFGVIAGALFGAATGSKLLYILDYWGALQSLPFSVWLSGKTIVGALLGGLIGVEFAKKFVNWPYSTGDRFVWPLIIGMMIGRLGCQLAGLEDLTYGGVTTMPWGWNYGDGVMRHPVALYEIMGLAGIAVLIQASRTRFTLAGDRFKLFLILYLALRVALDFLKPPHAPVALSMLLPNHYGPFTAIQWACLCGLVYYLPTVRQWSHRSMTKET